MIKKEHFSYGSHVIGNDEDGYMYSINSSTGRNYNFHIHKCYEIIHIISGKLIYIVEDSEYAVSDGDVIITNPDELHSFSFPSECEYTREFLHIYPGFLNAFGDLTLSLNSRKAGHANLIPKAIVTKYKLDSILDDIHSCCIDPSPETDLLVLSYTLQLLGRILRIQREETPAEHRPAIKRAAFAARSYIDHHYTEDITLESIADALFISPSYLSRTFKAELGVTVKTYLNTRRITRAKSLMKAGFKATNVYSECGFGDYSTFYRAFSGIVGMKPGEYVHMHKRKKNNVNN